LHGLCDLARKLGCEPTGFEGVRFPAVGAVLDLRLVFGRSNSRSSFDTGGREVKHLTPFITAGCDLLPRRLTVTAMGDPMHLHPIRPLHGSERGPVYPGCPPLGLPLG